MARRGEMLGLEYRYVLDEQSRGTLMFDFLDDRKIDDGTAGSEDWAYAETAARRNADRYWFRFKHDQLLPAGFTARLDIDLVSDPDYLREFHSGLTGFDATDRMLTKTFGPRTRPLRGRGAHQPSQPEPQLVALQPQHRNRVA